MPGHLHQGRYLSLVRLTLSGVGPRGLRCRPMKKLLLLAVLIALGAVAARKLRAD